MKKLLAILLALVLLFSLAACSKKNPEPSLSDTLNPENQTSGQQGEEAPYVEEVPAVNELNSSEPIPADTGTLTLSPVTFEGANLTLNLPEGVTATEEKGTDNNASICVSSDDGVWKLHFEPYKDGRNLLSFVTTTMIYAGDSIKQDWSQDVSTELGGFPTRVWANNVLSGWLHPDNWQDTPAVDMILDYGETLVGPWYGMHIRLEAQNPTEDTNIYELLYLRHVRAVLHNFEVLETPDGVTKSAGGITLTFPARWNVLQGDNGFVTSFNTEGVFGGINFGSATPADPVEAVSNREGENFSATIGGREYLCVVEERADDPETVYYNMSMFSEFSEERCLHLFVNIRGYSPSDYQAYLKDPAFAAVLESMEIDPNGYRKPGTASANGFETDRGVIYEYTGNDVQLEVPTVIGDMDTWAIGWGAFAGNTEITSIIIPEGVTSIEGCAFEDCTNLETVVFPNTLMEIGPYAFSGCTSLKNVVLPSAVTFVGAGAFSEAGCGSFSGPGAYYAYTCFNYAGFESITIGKGADLSGDYIFSGSAVSQVSLPADLEVLGQGAFSGCEALDEVTLPDTVRELGPNCFTNMGYLQIELSDSLEYIPDSCFSSTNLDVLVVPESVERIESYAIYDAAYVVLKNPEVELSESAIDCDYLYIADAEAFVFPDEMVLWVQRLYLDGVYDPGQIQGDLAAQYVDSQLYLPMDATLEEAAAMDEYLLSIGLGDIAWIGTDIDFLPTRTQGYDVDGLLTTGYNGSDALATIPEYVMIYDDPFWYTTLIEGVADGTFAGSGITTAYFRGSFWSGVGDGIFDGCTGLTDIWFNSSILTDLDNGFYSAQTFAGVPDGVTVHLPECVPDSMEEALLGLGLPETAVFDYYSLR